MRDERMQDSRDLAEVIRTEANGRTPCMDDPHRWFPDQNNELPGEWSAQMRSINATKQVCKSHCFVVAECLAYALEHKEDWGIWGGTSTIERRRLLALRRKSQTDNETVSLLTKGETK